MVGKMKQGEREAVKIVMADADRYLRNNLRQALFYAGFRTITDVGKAADLKAVLDEGQPDLLLIDNHLPDGDACAIVRSLRYSRVGRNPFLSVIMTAQPDDVHDLGRMIDSGTDHIVIKPIAPQAIFERMQALIERRKPFVATSGYIGPDRRKGKRDAEAAAAADIPTFEVPNTLRLKFEGKPVDNERLQQTIDQALGRINEELVYRHAFHIAFLVERVVPLLQREAAGADHLLRQISSAAQEMLRRIDSASVPHVVELLRALDGHVAAVARRIDLLGADDLTVLRKLSEAIYVSVNAGSNATELAQKIRETVQSYEKRQQEKRAGRSI